MAPERHRSYDESKMLLWFLSLWPMFIAVVIVAFPERFTSKAWKFAFNMPGGYALWGGVLIAVGIVMLTAMVHYTNRRYYLLLASMFLAGLWWTVLGLVFLITAIDDPLANPIGFVSWTPIGLFYWWQAWRIYRHTK